MLDVTARKRAEEALAAERSLLRTLIDIVPDYIYVKDTASRFLAANVAVARAMGASTPQDLLGKSDYDFYPERLAAEYRADEQAILRAGQPVINKDDPRVDPTGNRRAVLTTKVPFRDSQGKIIGLVGIGRDITERKRVEEAEREQRQLADTLRDIGMHLAAELNPDAILDILLEHVARVVPYDSASVMFLEDSHIRVKRSRGYERFGVAHLIGDFDLELATLGYLRRIAETRRPHIVADTRADPLWVEMETSRHIRSWAGAPIMARGQVLGFISLDKTEPNFYTPELAERLAAFAVQAGLALDNARLYAEQQRLAITDELTRIHNRRHLFELGEREFRRARRFGHVLSVIMLDIDHFKQVNDTYGHAVGDQVLLVLAERCRKNIRDVDVLGRYGGEEFAIILPETGLPAACEAAERLRQCVAQTRIPTNAGPLGITISLGVAALTESIRDLPSLLDRADAAMYAAKQAGRNRVSVG
jgi:diguanylate cyclase (GGDEF)-like protein/PAS domain S-box-containing protein